MQALSLAGSTGAQRPGSARSSVLLLGRPEATRLYANPDMLIILCLRTTERAQWR